MRLKKLDSFLFLSFFFLLLDQLSKELILRLNLETSRAPGLFFTFFSNQSYYFLALFLIIAFSTYLNLHSARRGLEIFATALLSGGALGNSLDHFYRRAPVDFLSLNWFLPGGSLARASYFNLADLFIVGGLFVFGLAGLIGQNRWR